MISSQELAEEVIGKKEYRLDVFHMTRKEAAAVRCELLERIESVLIKAQIEIRDRCAGIAMAEANHWLNGPSRSDIRASACMSVRDRIVALEIK
jgi:hypothetical protein